LAVFTVKSPFFIPFDVNLQSEIPEHFLNVFEGLAQGALRKIYKQWRRILLSNLKL